MFDKEFKTEAVCLATSGKRVASEVAANLKVNPSLLFKWITASRSEGPDAFRDHGKRTALEDEF